MNHSAPTNGAGRRAAVAAAIGFVSIALFQVALAVGAPLGDAAWGGAHAELSTAQRLASAAAVFVWTAAALIVLGRAGLWARGRLAPLFHWGTWSLVAASVLAALVNFASPSRWENLIFGPLALALVVLCTIVARSPTAEGRPSHSHAPRALPH